MEFVQPIRDKRQLEAIKRILKGNPGTGSRDHCLFVLGINSGLRVSDLLSLTVGDVVDEKGKLRDRITLREQKTGKAKNFPISQTAAKAIKEYLATRKDPTRRSPSSSPGRHVATFSGRRPTRSSRTPPVRSGSKRRSGRTPSVRPSATGPTRRARTSP
jgi:integrase